MIWKILFYGNNCQQIRIVRISYIQVAYTIALSKETKTVSTDRLKQLKTIIQNM